MSEPQLPKPAGTVKQGRRPMFRPFGPTPRTDSDLWYQHEADIKKIARLERELAQAKKLQRLTEDNQIRWMRKHDEAKRAGEALAGIVRKAKVWPASVPKKEADAALAQWCSLAGSLSTPLTAANCDAIEDAEWEEQK